MILFDGFKFGVVRVAKDRQRCNGRQVMTLSLIHGRLSVVVIEMHVSRELVVRESGVEV